jgi:SAM-dependent methyltransferase
MPTGMRKSLMPDILSVQDPLYVERQSCRIDNSPLVDILDLGVLAFTGAFPLPGDHVPHGPLAICIGQGSGLVQLKHDYSPSLFYTVSYGYRSGLNLSMVKHLERKAANLSRFIDGATASILDIGSNDGTLLNAYKYCLDFSSKSICRVGVDPTISAFQQFYDSDIITHSRFFDDILVSRLGDSAFDLITSVSMFYDLPDPLGFVSNISRVLKKTGVWHFEQSYLLSMLRASSFDTICHEHTEYYSVSVINNLLALNGLKIIDLSFNDVNGGSVAITAAHSCSDLPESYMLKWVLEVENSLGIHDPSAKIYADFIGNVYNTISSLNSLFDSIAQTGATIYGLGASTKGNTLLQMPGFNHGLIRGIFEVNESKYGHVTPGSSVPILPESQIIEYSPDYLFVLPWHFKYNLMSSIRDKYSLASKFIFPLPYPEVCIG